MTVILSTDHQDYLWFTISYNNKRHKNSTCVPSYSSGTCLIKSSSGKLICILAANGSVQKSYQPSSAQRTNRCRVWKSLLSVSDSRQTCWVWLRLMTIQKWIQTGRNVIILYLHTYGFQSHEIHPYCHPMDHIHTSVTETLASFAPRAASTVHLIQQTTTSRQ